MTSPRHSWDHEKEQSIAACDTQSGCSETIRTCRSCGLIMITVHPPVGLAVARVHTAGRIRTDQAGSSAALPRGRGCRDCRRAC
jgi:hypothetical protein